MLNLSISTNSAGACGSTYHNAINSARSRNSVVVVAAGNKSTTANHAPGNCAGVITVAATNRAGGRANYSNFGTSVEVAAPGGELNVTANGVLSTLNSGATTPLVDNYVFYQGTSMATPHVSGVVALMLELDPNLLPDQVTGYVQGYARAFPIPCSGCGSGILNARATLDAVAPITSPTGPPAPQWVTFAGCSAAQIAGGWCSPFYTDWLPTWIDMDYSSSGPVTSYELQVMQTSPTIGAWITVQTGTPTHYTYLMLQDTYWAFRVRACNSSGCGPFSATMDAGTSTP